LNDALDLSQIAQTEHLPHRVLDAQWPRGGQLHERARKEVSRDREKNRQRNVAHRRKKVRPEFATKKGDRRSHAPLRISAPRRSGSGPASRFLMGAALIITAR